jgi:hypothetical protein
MGTNFNFGWFNISTLRKRTTIRETFCLLLSIITLCPIRFERRTELPIHCLQNQVPTDYFSPKKFNAVELFMEILKDEKLEAKSWFYNANLATGFQFIETVVNNDGLTECKPNLVINSLID